MSNVEPSATRRDLLVAAAVGAATMLPLPAEASDIHSILNSTQRMANGASRACRTPLQQRGWNHKVSWFHAEQTPAPRKGTAEIFAQ